MNTTIVLLFTTICCLLENKQWASASALQKPILQLVTEDPHKNVMKGDNIKLNCITGSGSIFYLVHEKSNGQNETREGNSGEFSFMNIQIEQDGDYSCKYCKDHKICSELSSPLNVYVRDTFPRPDINVSPQRVVQPGATITITCSTHYSNVEFSLLKNNVIVKNGSSGNQLSYVISNAKNSDMGYYSCVYKSRTNGMRSMRSNPMKISVLALPAPLMTLEEDPRDSSMLRINCRAPDNLEYNEFFFTLLDGRKAIEEEIAAIGINVTFVVTKPKYSTKEYCMYRVKVDYDYADSLQSFVELESNRSWMLIRHILSALILMLTDILLTAVHLDWGYRLEIQAFPSKVVRKGGNVTIWCSSSYNQGLFNLLRKNSSWIITAETNVKEQNFTVTNVQESNSTDYYCYQYYDNKWQDYSDYLTLNVIDPKIIADYTTTNRIRLVLSGSLIILACAFVIQYWITLIKDEQSLLESPVKSEIAGEMEGAIYINDLVRG